MYKRQEYIDAIMTRITLPGSILLALVAIMPAFAGIFGVKAEFAQDVYKRQTQNDCAYEGRIASERT